MRMDFIFINFLQCVWKVEKTCYIDGSNFDENGFYFNFLQCVSGKFNFVYSLQFTVSIKSA